MSAARFDVRLAEKAEWLKVFDPRDATVSVVAEDPPNVGDLARVDLIVGAAGPRVILRGKVIARRFRADGGLLPGFSLALGPGEREKVNYLNGFVRGGLLDLRERRRLPLRCRVTFGGLIGPVTTFTRDLNEEGVFIVTDAPLPEQSELHLRLEVPVRDEPIRLRGVVSHTVLVEDEDVPGMGIRFQLSAEEAPLIGEVVDALEALFLADALPDEYLL
jgi:hypothetical protein